ncbi:MAG: hypothetical protein R3E66_11030 [bacterium]
MRYPIVAMVLVGLTAGCVNDVQSVSADECLSTEKWTGGNSGDSQMNPGQACIQCHRGNGGPNYKFAGTIYEDYTQKDNCFGIDGYTIELTDANGTVHTAKSNGAGNFFKSSGTIVGPYTALVRGPDGSERPMLTPQTNTDCNTCHGATGSQGAPGRIVIP